MPEETLQISFHITACFLFCFSFSFFKMLMCSFGFIALVLSCSPQGLAVACGIQSLDQESSEFFFYWNKVDLQHCVCCRCTRSCPVICVCHHLQICFRGINIYTLLTYVKLTGNETYACQFYICWCVYVNPKLALILGLSCSFSPPLFFGNLLVSASGFS